MNFKDMIKTQNTQDISNDAAKATLVNKCYKGAMRIGIKAGDEVFYVNVCGEHDSPQDILDAHEEALRRLVSIAEYALEDLKRAREGRPSQAEEEASQEIAASELPEEEAKVLEEIAAE